MVQWTTKETKLGHAILITKEKMKKADEKFVRLRHKFKYRMLMKNTVNK